MIHFRIWLAHWFLDLASEVMPFSAPHYVELDGLRAVYYQRTQGWRVK